MRGRVAGQLALVVAAGDDLAVDEHDRADGHVAVGERGARLLEASAIRASPARRTAALQRPSRCIVARTHRLAEGVGFEPTVSCPTHAFQACRFGRSRTPPGVGSHRRRRDCAVDGRMRRLSSTSDPLPVRWWSGPVQPEPVNQVRAGRQQPSAESPVCRRSPGRHCAERRPTASRSVSRQPAQLCQGSPGSSRSRWPTSRSTAATDRSGSARCSGQEHVVQALRNAVARRAASATPTCSAGPAAPARPRPPASSPRPSTARTSSTASRAACATPAWPIDERHVVRRHRARRRVEQRRRRHPRPHRPRAPLGTPGRTQGVHPRRGPHALHGGVERAAEDARGAARPRRVRARHHRPAEGAAHHPQPHPALRVHLLSADELAAARRPASSATPGSTLDRRGARPRRCAPARGSARDTLSAARPGRRRGRRAPTTRDAGRRARRGARATATPAAALRGRRRRRVAAGHDPRVLGEALLGRLRDVFLASAHAELDRVTPSDRERRSAGQAAQPRHPLGHPGPRGARPTRWSTCAGAPDPAHRRSRSRSCASPPDADASPSALLERIDRARAPVGLRRAWPRPGPAAPPAPDRPAGRAPARAGAAAVARRAGRPTAPAAAAAAAAADTAPRPRQRRGPGRPPGASRVASAGPAPAAGGRAAPRAPPAAARAAARPTREPPRRAGRRHRRRPRRRRRRRARRRPPRPPAAPPPAPSAARTGGALPRPPTRWPAGGPTTPARAAARSKARPRFHGVRLPGVVDGDTAVFGAAQRRAPANVRGVPRRRRARALAEHFGRADPAAPRRRRRWRPAPHRGRRPAPASAPDRRWPTPRPTSTSSTIDDLVDAADATVDDRQSRGRRRRSRRRRTSPPGGHPVSDRTSSPTPRATAADDPMAGLLSGLLGGSAGEAAASTSAPLLEQATEMQAQMPRPRPRRPPTVRRGRGRRWRGARSRSPAASSSVGVDHRPRRGRPRRRRDARRTWCSPRSTTPAPRSPTCRPRAHRRPRRSPSARRASAAARRHAPRPEATPEWPSVYAGPVQDLIDELGRLPGVGPEVGAAHRLPPAEAAARGRRCAWPAPSSRPRTGSPSARAASTSPRAPLCGICADDRRDATRAVRGRGAHATSWPSSRPASSRAATTCSRAPSAPSRASAPTSCGSRSCWPASSAEGVTEVILCTNPNIEGEATAMYLGRAAQAARAARSPASPAACPWAATSSTPTSSPSAGPSKAAAPSKTDTT